MPSWAERIAHLRRLPDPAPVRSIAFSDFDETYLAHTADEAARRDLAALEEFLLRAAGFQHLLFGWVTGSSTESVVTKAERHGLTVLPHFIASSLATELMVLDGDVLRPDPGWTDRLQDCGWSPAAVRRVVEALDARGVTLQRQPIGGATAFVENFYLSRADSDAAQLVRAMAAEHGLGVNVSRCNPAAGDPAGSHDVDFFPRTCGKAGLVHYLCEQFSVPTDRTFAFGDSGGDLEMLAAVGHGVLVGNCTADTREAFPRVSDRSYAGAILHTLRDIEAQPPHSLRTRPRQNQAEST